MGLVTMVAEGTDRFTKYMEKLTSVIGHAIGGLRCMTIVWDSWRQMAAKA
jgi:hypothetical protein